MACSRARAAGVSADVCQTGKKRQHVCPLIMAVSEYENVFICYPTAAKSTFWPRGKTGAGGLAFCYTRNAKGLRDPERKGCVTPVELDSSRRSCKRSMYVRGKHEKCRFFFEGIHLFYEGFHATVFVIFILFSAYTKYTITCDQPLHVTTGSNRSCRLP